MHKGGVATLKAEVRFLITRNSIRIVDINAKRDGGAYRLSLRLQAKPRSGLPHRR
jgi:hypothetical protein